MRSGFHWQLRLQWCTAGEWPGTVVVAGGGEQSMGHRVAGRIGIGIGTGPAATTLGVAWRGVASRRTVVSARPRLGFVWVWSFEFVPAPAMGGQVVRWFRGDGSSGDACL
jgi:hypothetical protein